MLGLIENRSLSTLYIQKNNIGDKGAQSIAETIKKNAYIQKLDFNWNQISIEGMKSISEALTYNCTILTFNSYNDIASSEIRRYLEKNNKRYQTECKMLTFELFKQISMKKLFIDMHLTVLVLKFSGIEK